MAEGVITVYLEDITNEGVVCPRSDVVVGKVSVNVMRHDEGCKMLFRHVHRRVGKMTSYRSRILHFLKLVN